MSEAIEKSAQSVYQQRLTEREAEATRRAGRAAITSNLRLVVFFSGVLVAWLVFGTRSLAGGWLFPPAIGFGVLLVVHDRLLVRKERALRSVAFYQRGLDRLTDAWAGGGEKGERFRDSNHPYAEDLDLFGEGTERSIALRPQPSSLLKNAILAFLNLAKCGAEPHTKAQNNDLRRHFVITSV